MYENLCLFCGTVPPITLGKMLMISSYDSILMVRKKRKSRLRAHTSEKSEEVLLGSNPDTKYSHKMIS